MIGKRQTIAIVENYTSLIGVGQERPCSWGNYWHIIHDDKSYKVINMWYENYMSANKHFALGNAIDVILYEKHVLFDDDRIPEEWYYNKFYDLNMGGLSLDEAKEVLEYFGDPESIEYWTDTKSYYEKRGAEYITPKKPGDFGIVRYKIGKKD